MNHLPESKPSKWVNACLPAAAPVVGPVSVCSSSLCVCFRESSALHTVYETPGSWRGKFVFLSCVQMYETVSEMFQNVLFVPVIPETGRLGGFLGS